MTTSGDELSKATNIIVGNDELNTNSSFSSQSEKLTWLHIRRFMIDGAMFFIDCYDGFMLAYFVLYVSLVYFDGDIPYIYDILLKSGTPAGALVVQWASYTFAGKIKNPVPNAGLIIVLASSIGISLTGRGRGLDFIAALIFWRFMFGVGFSLDNPFKAILDLPQAKYSTNPKLVMKGIWIPFTLAILAGSAISLAVAGGFRYVPADKTDILDYGWRIYEAITFIPTAIALYYRMTENNDNNVGEIDKKADIERTASAHTLNESVVPAPDIWYDSITPAPDIPVQPAPVTWSSSINHFSKPRNLLPLLGGMYTMFVTILGVIFTPVGFLNTSTPATTNYTITVGVVIVSLGILPGYLAATLLIDKIGRKYMQLIAFAGMTIIYGILGFAFDQVKDASPILFILLMSLSNTFVQLGPNGTSLSTFKPTLLSPTSEPSPNGYYGAMRNLGVIAAQFLFIYCKNIGGLSAFVRYLYEIYALLSVIGFFITVLLPNPQPFEKN
ncbi:hypothetical protein CONCODRAFT_79784 [Conidiobolus coronatus NRRL 28638]|uniref:MFS general substrate transporter n=1 Tax=Conidiobolus coronatus (strain ATCC 28846 / CBS 209.66 / NRRL 28638) TaxID=796925 RepID=A0A137P004_CONC2|nr:hypothetical protein CONCODRAFT_79784 [Conidiobolus coronatus NRRL 28638]|eukprot:KXN68322.1 hypothetical protein CONCODRAFT_79784 [Conidiobolus coronatus NRRL 28638]